MSKPKTAEEFGVPYRVPAPPFFKLSIRAIADSASSAAGALGYESVSKSPEGLYPRSTAQAQGPSHQPLRRARARA